jgi:hypothetical protein
MLTSLNCGGTSDKFDFFPEVLTSAGTTGPLQCLEPVPLVPKTDRCNVSQVWFEDPEREHISIISGFFLEGHEILFISNRKKNFLLTDQVKVEHIF